jgi:hypothetical protein
MIARQKAIRESFERSPNQKEFEGDRPGIAEESARPAPPVTPPEVLSEETSQNMGTCSPVESGEFRESARTARPSGKPTRLGVGWARRLLGRMVPRGWRIARLFGRPEPVKPPEPVTRPKRDKRPDKVKRPSPAKRQPGTGRRGAAASRPEREPRLTLSVPRADEFRPAVVRCHSCDLVVTQDGRCRC